MTWRWRTAVVAFGAPVRNDSDTAWMKERQIEAMYRSRFQERRHAAEALDHLTSDASADRDTIHPLDNVDLLNPRPGLRRWVGVNSATDERSQWRESWASIHHDGSVTIVTAVGGHRSSRAGEQSLIILAKDGLGHVHDGASVPLHRFTPVEMTVNAAVSASEFYRQAHDLALDCVNQGGISGVRMIRPPEREDQA
jgi:hypothetical protein